MSDQIRGGLLSVSIDGVQQDAIGDFSYNLGAPKREALVGSDGVHGYKQTPQVPFIEGAIRDSSALDLKALTSIKDSTITVQKANGKVVALRNAWYAGEGTATTEEGNIPVRFEGKSAEEIS